MTSETILKESDPMEVDHISKGKGKRQRAKGKGQRAAAKAKGK